MIELIEKHRIELTFDGAEGGVWAANLASGGDMACAPTATAAIKQLLEKIEQLT